MRRARGTTVLVLAALLLLPPSARAGVEELLARGDAAWARRSLGQHDGRARPEPIAEALAAYAEAFEAAPQSQEAAWKLLRAHFFEAEYAASDDAARKAVLARARERARIAEARLAASLGRADLYGGEGVEALAAVLRGNPHAAPLCFWSALLLASWAREAGPVAALGQGVADTLRRHAELVIALDPAYEAGGAHRLLGRLHAEVPRIPFVTPWVQRERALGELRRALALAPEDPWNQLLLGLTLLELAPAERPAALQLLQQAAGLPPRSESAVEDLGVGRMARDALARVGAP